MTIKKIAFIVLLSCISISHLFSQRCETKKLAPKELLGNYEYQSQSAYTQVGTGDTIRIKTIVYSQYDYRIFVAGEKNLGKIHFEIIMPEKRFEPYPQNVIDKEIILYKKDKNGFLEYDENENPIPIGKTTIKDTIWGRQLVTYEQVIFNSNEAPYWEASINKTRLLIVKIIVPKKRRFFFGCIGLMVGRKSRALSDNLSQPLNE
ncbi:MAG TPA: hypothetical protein PK990_10350 [Salinivirgaceae bacterium]|nr:hypothetical protein [Salinivirgaceae bacterium]